MKKIIKNFLIVVFAFGVLSGTAIGQAKTEISEEKLESPYDEVNLKFGLDANPTPEEVGFDNPKSYWKFSYELRFLENEKAAQEKLGYKYFQENSGENNAERAKRIERNNKQYNKVWKKFGVVAGKGKVSKISLLSVESRELFIPVELSPEIKNVLARANSLNEFPEFRVLIKGKIYSKTKSNLMFKQKISSSYTCPTKMIVKGTPNWMMNTCGIYIEVTEKNNKIFISSTSRL